MTKLMNDDYDDGRRIEEEYDGYYDYHEYDDYYEYDDYDCEVCREYYSAY